MTVKVAGVWELGWSTPIKEIDDWLLLRDFTVDEFCMTPVSGIASGKVTEFSNINAVVQSNPDLTPIYIDECGEIELASFEHPVHCLYIFGKASFSPWTALAKPKGCSVRITTPQNLGLLWPHQAAAIVLYDRFMKG